MSGLLSWAGSAMGIPAEVMALQPKDFATLVTLNSPFLSGLLAKCNLNVDKLTVNDERYTHGYAEVNGTRWHYLDAVPKVPQRGTVFLVHGWPDLAFAWRYQIPMLLGLGMRCIAIDCMGYGETGTSIPPTHGSLQTPSYTHDGYCRYLTRKRQGVSENLADYTLKAHADGIAGIAKAIGVHKIILGGHDWGGMVVYRAAQWYPELVSHVFSVATPYMEPQKDFLDPAAVRERLPNLGYQLQLGSKEQVVENAVKSEKQVRKFLQGMYGGAVKSGKPIMTAEKGITLDVITDDNEKVGPSPLMSKEVCPQPLPPLPPPYPTNWLLGNGLYVASYVKTSFHGPCNWYRTHRMNYDEDLALPESARAGANQITQPTLFIQALLDFVLIPSMSIGMEDKIPLLTRGEVNASHWALWHTPGETNEVIRRWMEGVVLGGKSKL